MPGPCKGHKSHIVSPGYVYCYRCAKRVYKHHDKDLQRKYKEYLKQLHTHWFIAGYCITCGLDSGKRHRPWKEFLKNYDSGYWRP